MEHRGVYIPKRTRLVPCQGSIPYTPTLHNSFLFVMASSIFQYKLNSLGATVLELPVSEFVGQPIILDVGVQDKRDVVVYVQIDDSNATKTEPMTFYCAATGANTLPKASADCEWYYSGTCHLGDGSHAVHVFIQY